MSEKLLLKLYMSFSLKPLIKRNIPSVEEHHHLRLVGNVDAPTLQEEIETLSAAWWMINAARQLKISHHQDTWSIQVRRMTASDVHYSPADGVHESVASDIAFRFPRIHETVLKLAEELNIGLGRVAIVKMKPWSEAYRHFDAERMLIGRNRYHLVMQCGKQNFLSSGPETVNAREGEVWFFDNKAMHRAYNKSSVPRIHVIFDGYPLDQHAIQESKATPLDSKAAGSL